MRRRAPKVTTQGFTLVERLVGLTLMALLSVILFGGLRFGMRAWEAGGEHVEQASRLDTMQNLLRRQVSQARLPELDAGTESRPLPAFVGEPERLQFIAPLPAHRGAGGSYLFHLAVAEGDGRPASNAALRPAKMPGPSPASQSRSGHTEVNAG